MNETTRILIIEDRPTDAELVKREVRRTLPNSEFLCVETEEAFLSALKTFRPDLILSDYTLPKFSGMTALKLAKVYIPEIPFILVTGSINEETAVSCMKAGASDYILKDRISRIGTGILNCMEQKRLRDETLRSEQALKASRTTMATALASMTDAVFITDTGGTFIECNHSFATFHKFSSLNECPQSVTELAKFIDRFSDHGKRVPLDNWPSIRALQGETVTNVEYTLHRSDTGETWEGSYSFSPIRDEQGIITGSVVVARDITEHKKAEAERERLVLAIDQAAETFLITDKSGAILYANPSFEESTGYTREEVLGKNPRILKSGQQDDAFYQDLWKMLDSGETWRGRFINKKKDETLYTEEASISPVLDATGKIVSYVAVKKDITAELEKDQAFKQAQKMESIGLLAGGVAHDFNNKLQVILGYADIALGKTAPNGAVHAHLIEIQKAALLSADLTRQLLAFARKQTITPKILDLNSVIETMLKMLRRLIGEDIDLIWQPARNLWPVKMDPSQIDQILANLCVNARDAIDGIGAITIETQNATLEEAYCAGNPDAVPGDYLLVSITDNGCGMEKELLTHIYEPFFTSKDIGQGTGLGLATVYGIIKQNNGIIMVDSAPDQGTTFNIYLPRCMEVQTTPTADTAKDSPIRGQETILLVEDSLTVLDLTRSLFQTLGYTVLTADLPSKALELAQAYPDRIDLLVTDVIMPEMNGPELAARMQSILPNIKCLFMSGYTADVIGPSNVMPANVHFIQKPFSIKDMSQKIRISLETK